MLTATELSCFLPQDPGPYPQDIPPQNSVRFTPVQTQAILAGVQPGLTMVVGPPGRTWYQGPAVPDLHARVFAPMFVQ